MFALPALVRRLGLAALLLGALSACGGGEDIDMSQPHLYTLQSSGTQFVRLPERFTVELPYEPASGWRWEWEPYRGMEYSPTGDRVTETRADGRQVDVFRFVAQEYGTVFVHFLLKDLADPDAAPKQKFTVPVNIGRY